MSRFRKIDVRMWGDKKFKRLSRPPPNGQSLWQYLLTNPFTVSVPGLFSAGRMQLAEALEWPVEGFDKAFAEASSQGMVKADWQARVVWVPRAIKYNTPESPNVVIGWASHLDELPECPLKHEGIRGLRAFIEGLGEGFQKAFEKICPKAMPNQEQEQEQEQERDPDPTPPPSELSANWGSAKASNDGSGSGAESEDPDLSPKPEDAQRAEHLAQRWLNAILEQTTTQPAPRTGGRWSRAYSYIGSRMLAAPHERVEVERGLRAELTARKLTARMCTPQHVADYWHDYAAGTPPSRGNGGNGGHGGTGSYGGRGSGPGPVGTPEEFAADAADEARRENQEREERVRQQRVHHVHHVHKERP